MSFPEIAFQWVGGATFILSIGDFKIACDPVLCPKGTTQTYLGMFKSTRLEEPVYQGEDFQDIGLWLITHSHEDHLDEKGIAVISKSSRIIADKKSSAILENHGFENQTVLAWHENTSLNLHPDIEITVEAVPAIHGVNPATALLAGKVSGYYLTIKKESQEAHIYITSDTVYKKKVINALKGRPIDIMIPNIGAATLMRPAGILTMNSRMLQRFMDELQPALVVPVHFGTFQHYLEPVSEVRKLNRKNIQIPTPGAGWKIEPAVHNVLSGS